MVKARKEQKDCLEERKKMRKRSFHSSSRIMKKIVSFDKIEPRYRKYNLLLGPVFFIFLHFLVVGERKLNS